MPTADEKNGIAEKCHEVMGVKKQPAGKLSV
jgi:hypothetical protein